jgi:hypothetical protein
MTHGSTKRADLISHAISPSARDYLERVFQCTTFSHLMRLGEYNEDGSPNVFDENVRETPGEDTRLDQEIGGYILAVKENREPYDPAEHEFIVEPMNDGRHELFTRGTATADEWESLGVVDSRDPTATVRENLFNQLVAPRVDSQTYYPDKQQAAEPAAIRLENKVVEAWQDDNGDIQIRVIDNADCLITRMTVSGGGVERLWHPGPSGDDDSPQEVTLQRAAWP